ncbi:MAG: hypothetical protein ACYDA5_07910 [Vulcanimicrobiaceae bacterium]
MKQRLGAAALVLTMMLGTMAPALANGAASTRNILLLGTAAGLLITNYNHKVRAKRAEQHEAARRQTAYRDWFYHKYGYYPTYAQFKKWYFETYHVNPS